LCEFSVLWIFGSAQLLLVQIPQYFDLFVSMLRVSAIFRFFLRSFSFIPLIFFFVFFAPRSALAPHAFCSKIFRAPDATWDRWFAASLTPPRPTLRFPLTPSS